QPHGAKGADPTITHDLEPLRRIVTAERVQAVGKPVQMEPTGHQLPGGHGQKSAEEHRKGPRGQAIDDDEDAADQEPDRAQPRDGASGWRADRAALATDRDDGQVARGLQGPFHGGDSSTFGLTTAATRRTLGDITASHPIVRPGRPANHEKHFLTSPRGYPHEP